MLETQRYLGLELAGAKNQKSAIAALQFYPRERKLFLLDIFDHIAPHEDQTGDQALLELIEEESQENETFLGVNAALQLPPCIECTRKNCFTAAGCSLPAAKWMVRHAKKGIKRAEKPAKIREYTPYTQRPIELWIRQHILPKLPPSHAFEIDETLGGNRAPLTARMHYLKRHLKKQALLEVWPKLTVSILAFHGNIPKRIISSYRHLEDGAYSREIILQHLIQHFELFIYERDLRKLSQSLTAFDAFICALTAWLSHQGVCTPPPKGFPVDSGWVQFPAFSG